MKREEFTYQTNTGEFVAEKLLPCPFCGGEPEFVTIGNDYTKSRKAEIKCIKCFCKRTTGAIHNNLEWCGRKAIELWNKRTAEHPLPPTEGADEIKQALCDDIEKSLNGAILDQIFDSEQNGLPLVDYLSAGSPTNTIGAGKREIENIVEQIYFDMEDWQSLAALQPQPTAEGAEEIRVEYSEESLGFFRSFIRARKELCAISPTETYSLEEAIRKAFDGFATLHAQKIADKMVSEKLNDIEFLLVRASGLVGNPGTNISGSCDVACNNWQRDYEEYLKSRDSHE